MLDAYGRCFKAENQTHLWSLQDLDTFNGTFENVVIRNSFFQDLLDNHPRLSYCEGYFLEPGDVYKITENGSLSHVGHALTMDYCIDNVAENGSLATKVVRCARLDNPICNNTDVCFNSSHAPFYPEEVENKLKDTSLLIFMSICGVISLICLAFTFLVYWIIPGFNNLHGKIVQSNIISIAILTVYLLIVFNAKLFNDTFFCIVIGFFGYFASISMFSWMTIMCFDLYWTFSRSELPSTTTDRLKFRIYSVIGWGAALLFTVTLGIFQLCLPPESEFNPAIGSKRCFIDHNGKSSLYLFYIPMLIIMVFNILIFFAIILAFIIAKKTTKEAWSSTR